jgi:hypothetical protein
MPKFILHHTHEPRECAVAFAAWRGVRSPLRRHAALSSCPFGGHELWWELDAADEGEALALLPDFVAERATAIRVRPVEIP